MSHIDDLIRQHCPNGVEHRFLGEVGQFERGSGIQKSDFVESGVGCIHYGQIHTHYGTWATETKSFVTPEQGARGRRAKTGDLVVATTSEDDAAVGKAVAWLGAEEVAVSTDAVIYRHSLHPKYVAYFFQTEQFHAQKRRHVTGTKVRRIAGGALAKIRIPAPPLEVQREVVRVLDRFKGLESELASELEWELRARRSQHAHHRKTMLTSHNWPVERLGALVTNLDRLRRPVTRRSRSAGMYPYYGANGVQDHVDDFIFDGTYLLVGEDGSVTQADGTPILNWATGKIWVNNHAHVLAEKDDGASLRFLYHQLRIVDIRSFVTGTAQPKLNQGNMNDIPVHVPPRAEQDRIVSVLDQFDALANNLSVGLSAELAARRTQYEYYRDRLLTFEEAA